MGNSTFSPIGLTREFGHFPAAFLFPLRIAQRLSICLWAFPSGYPMAFKNISQRLLAKSGHFLIISNEAVFLHYNI
jgi:hypothetical protein